MTVRCVVFDLDDTLFLERDYVRSGLEAVGRWLEEERDVWGFVRVAWSSFEEGIRGHLFDVVLTRLGVDVAPELIAELVAVYRNHRPRIAVLPDAAASLRDLRGRCSTAVVTDGPAASQRAKVAALGLERLMDHIVLTADLGDGYGKPHPHAFRMVERRSGPRGPACVYVADNPAKDFAGPKQLGWRTVRVRRPEGLHARVPSGTDVDVETDELSDLGVLIR